ncbi:transcriptional regulator [Opitutaceae bacterium TAV1]|nr:transcriptional regulator [Opitutaceae bacterium TAV1]
MATQADIARNLKLNQATVSLALRGHTSIPEPTRERVRREAERVGYRPNSYVSSLMSHIRAGRPLKDRGCIAVMVDAKSESDWWSLGETYRWYQTGMARQAERLGFALEFFFLGQQGMRPERVDEILYARGIRGLVLGAPCREHKTEPVSIHWERYACVTTGYSWGQPVDRVANDQYGNVLIAYAELLGRGYRRIGMSLSVENLRARGSRWLGGYAQSEQEYFGGQRMPVFFDSPERPPVETFRAWLDEYRPEAVITLTGQELEWLQALKKRVPEDIGLVTVIRPHDSVCSGVEERNELIGAVTMEQVVTQIMRNGQGLPVQARLTLVEGEWVEGGTLRKRNADVL